MHILKLCSVLKQLSFVLIYKNFIKITISVVKYKKKYSWCMMLVCGILKGQKIKTKWQRCDHFGWRISSRGVHVCLMYYTRHMYNLYIYINSTGLYLKIIILFSRRDKQKNGPRPPVVDLSPTSNAVVRYGNKHARQTDFPLDYYYYFYIGIN